MVFSSIIFIFYFLPVFLVLYYLTGARNAILLVGSTLFYTWGEGPYVLLLLALVALNWAGGFVVQRAREAGRRWVLPLFVTADLIVLGVFKYSGFLAGEAGDLVGASIGGFDLPLPLGISFFTFQLVSYLVDVNRNATPAEKDPIKLATYVMMFPHLVAGPIVRYRDIAGELAERKVGVDHVGLGIQYFIVGLCQKVLIANTVAVAADRAFGLPAGELTTTVAWVGIAAYTLQIYFDFCGYSNMAIGLASCSGSGSRRILTTPTRPARCPTSGGGGT